jgi:transposase
MPKAHRRYSEWTPSRIIAWGEKSGPNVGKLFREIMAIRPHPEQGYRSCLGIIRLEKEYGSRRLEQACKRALAIGSPSYKSVKSILKAGLDKQELLILPDPKPIEHPNIRGRGYYQ